MSIVEWLNKEVKMTQKVSNVTEEFKDFFLYSELFHKLDLMDSDDWNKYERNKYSKGNHKTNYDNTLKIIQHKMKL
jgi:hypothetical protein